MLADHPSWPGVNIGRCRVTRGLAVYHPSELLLLLELLSSESDVLEMDESVTIMIISVRQGEVQLSIGRSGAKG